MIEVAWREGSGEERRGGWLSPSADPPARVATADDRTTAREALAGIRRGEALLYRGDYHNARQLLAALGRRLRARSAPTDPRAAWRAERERRRVEREVLTRVLVPIEEGFRVPLRRAPDVTNALMGALGPAASLPGLLPLRDLLGMVGAHEWHRRGVSVPALGASVHPRFGVYAPVRGEYVELVARAAAASSVAGKRAFDVGTGTGVLAFVLARAGAAVVATDAEPRAVASARDDAERLGLGGRVDVRLADLFPDGVADVVVSNPPWLPDEARTPLERAVYDPGGRFLDRLVRGLPDHLAPGGEGWIVLSDLAELLGLRPPGHLAALAAGAGLRVAEALEARAAHPRAGDRGDPLHAFRAREVTRLFRLVPA